MKIQERLDEISEGFALALLAPGEEKPNIEKAIARFEGGEGCQILAMAQGGIGILRAMTVRCGGFPDGFALIEGWPIHGSDRSKFGTIYKLELVDGKPILNYIACRFYKQERTDGQVD
jgi:hypothetical protein